MGIQGGTDISMVEKTHILRALKHRNFSLFYIGNIISLVGTWSQTLAISWLVWRITESPIWLGMAGFMVQFPMLIFSLLGGVFADRHDRLRSLIFLQFACMAQAVALAWLTMAGQVELWHVIALSGMLGVIYSFEFPVRQSFIMDMVGRQDLLNAISLNSAMMNATRAAGPVIAGFIVAWKGEGVCFLFNAATFIFLIALLAMIDRQKLIPFTSEKKPMLEAVREGLGHMWKEKELRISVALICIVSLLGIPIVQLMPIFADVVLGGGSVWLGMLMGANAFGAFLGALALARRRKDTELVKMAAKSLVMVGVGQISFSLATGMLFAAASAAAFGFFMSITISCCMTTLQHNVPDHLRGRMMSLFTMGFMGFAPIGSLASGFVAQEIGAPHTIMICGVACVLTSAIALMSNRRLGCQK